MRYQEGLYSFPIRNSAARKETRKEQHVRRHIDKRQFEPENLTQHVEHTRVGALAHCVKTPHTKGISGQCLLNRPSGMSLTIYFARWA